MQVVTKPSGSAIFSQNLKLAVGMTKDKITDLITRKYLTRNNQAPTFSRNCAGERLDDFGDF
jgi:hypothetical protein